MKFRSDIQNLSFLQFASSQKWPVRMKHFLNPRFLDNQRPTRKRRKFQMFPFFNFHLTEPSTLRKGKDTIRSDQVL